MTHSPDSHYLPSSTDGDLLPVVDEQDRLLGCRTRRDIHRERLRHRAVHVVIHDGAGRVLLQKRSRHKDSFPGWWDISVGGHVDFGEMYDEATRRELREEMGVSAPFTEVGRRDASPESGWEFIRLYNCRHAGPFSPPAAEIDEVRWVDASELLRNAHSNAEPPEWRITPSGLASIRLWAALCGVA